MVESHTLDESRAPAGSPQSPDGPRRDLFARLRDLPYRTEIAGALLILLAIEFVFPKRAPIGIWGLGLVTGAAFAMQAIGLILVFRSNRFINFSQVAIGSTVATLFVVSVNYVPLLRLVNDVCPPCLDFTKVTRTSANSLYAINFWISLALALGLSLLLGWAIYAVVVRRFANAPRLVLTVASIFLATALPSLASLGSQLMTTSDQRENGLRLGNASLPKDFTISFGSTQFHAADILLVLTAIAAAAALFVYFRKSATGTAIRAASENPGRAETLGINVTRVTSRVWLIAGLLSGLAAAIGSMQGGANLNGGIDVGTLVIILAVAVIARMSSLTMAVVGAVVLGILQQATLWSFGSTTLLDGGLVVIIGVLLLLQRYRTSRAEIEHASGWQATKEIRPTPSELKDLATVKKWRRVLSFIGLASLLAFPWLMSPSQTDLGAVAMIFGIIGLSLLVLTGWAGQISLGQFGFAAIGGYVTAAVHLPLLLALVVSALAGAVVAALVGLPALKLRGLHLAIMTLAFAVTVTTVLLNPRYLGRVLPDTLKRPSLVGMNLDDQRVFYYFVLVVLALVVFAVIGLRRTRTGRALIAARDNDRAAQSFGINITRARLGAFAASGFFAALAGALYAYSQGGAKVASFGPEQSLLVFMMTVIGGLGSVAGPLIGAVYEGILLLFASSDLVRGLLTGFGGLVLLLLVPGGLAKVFFDLRDAALRRIASRNHIIVASLVADVHAADVDHAAPIAPKLRQRGAGTAFVPTRYELEGQWSLAIPDAIVAPGTPGYAAVELDASERDAFRGLAVSADAGGTDG